jgi:hypothetical protein
VHGTVNVDGDVEHLKVRIDPGQRLYVGDDIGRVYQVDVREKPSRARIALGVTRVR